MKKISLLALTLLASLPGCCNKDKSTKQTQPSNIEQNIDMFSSDVANAFASDEYSDEDSDEYTDNLRTFFDFDEDAQEFVADEESPVYKNFDLETGDIEEQEYAWVDAQSEDELKSLYFAFNNHSVREDQKQAIEHDIEQLQQLIADAGTDSQPMIVVEGHACQEGSPAYNLALSEKRAKNVADLLVAAGFDKENIKIVGRGQEVPAIIDGKVVDGTREERAPNRRVELHVIYT